MKAWELQGLMSLSESVKNLGRRVESGSYLSPPPHAKIRTMEAQLLETSLFMFHMFFMLSEREGIQLVLKHPVE